MEYLNLIQLLFFFSQSLIVLSAKIRLPSISKLPFTSVKMIEDDIFFTLDKDRSNWHRLLSIDNVGADVYIHKAKEEFGLLNCDGEIQCYKYNIIVNFEKVYSIVNKVNIPDHVSVEYMEKNVTKQTGIDIESTNDKLLLYKTFIDQNIKDSKTRIFSNL